MKYLTSINEKYNKWACEKTFSPLIDWNFVEDLKDMSLEYLDEGGSLYLSFIYLSGKNNNQHELFRLIYKHGGLYQYWYEVNEVFVKFPNISKLFYKFKISYLNPLNPPGGYDYQKLINNDLRERVLDAYPNMKNKIL